jgi:hypothetical protein
MCPNLRITNGRRVTEELIVDTTTALNSVGPIMMAVREEMVRLQEEHSCILTSAVLTEVLHRAGYSTAACFPIRHCLAIENTNLQSYGRAGWVSLV